MTCCSVYPKHWHGIAQVKVVKKEFVFNFAYFVYLFICLFIHCIQELDGQGEKENKPQEKEGAVQCDKCTEETSWKNPYRKATVI